LLTKLPIFVFIFSIFSLAAFSSGAVLNSDIIISISPSSIPPGTVGVPYSVWVVAYPYNPNYQWKLTGLPPGITYRVVDGNLNIYGTPTHAGNYWIYGKVSNGYGAANFNYPLPVRYSKAAQE